MPDPVDTLRSMIRALSALDECTVIVATSGVPADSDGLPGHVHVTDRVPQPLLLESVDLGAAAFLSILFPLAGSRISERLTAAFGEPAFRRLAEEPANARALDGVLRADGSLNLEDSAFLRALDPRVAQPFLEGYVSAMQVVFLTGAAVCLTAFTIAAWRMPNTKLSSD
jgi:hypothetical protein